MASEDDLESFSENQGGKRGLIFLIDATLPMFAKDSSDSEEKTKFKIAIECCRNVLMNQIIAKQNDLVGVVLFGTDKPDLKTNLKHITLLLELNYPNAEAVKQLDKLLNDSNSVEYLQTYSASEDFLLSDALWYCSSLFSYSGTNLEKKKILLFTGTCSPHHSSPDHAHMARKRAKDLNQLKISLELYPMGTDFDYSVFYKELVEIANGPSEFDSIEPIFSLEKILERVNRLNFKTRRYSKIKWNLGKNVNVGISLYTIYREATVLSKEPLNRATNEPVKRVKQTYAQTSGELLLPSDVEEYLSIGGSEIAFLNEDMENLKKIMEPGLTLLGFKPLSYAMEAMHCGQPAFAYPEESLVTGSRELVKTLVDRCISNGVVALCAITPRHRALTKYVGLVPCQQISDSKGNQISQYGFHVIPLPFNNDLREQDIEKSPQVDSKTIEIAKRLVNKLKVSYRPAIIKNPKLQEFWAHLEALALEYDVPKTIEDETVPNADEQRERLGELAIEFNSLCSLTGSKTASKRPASTSHSTSSPKQAKSSALSDYDQAIKEAIPNNKVESFTVYQLKEFLTSHNQSIKGMRKPDLVQAVYKLKF